MHENFTLPRKVGCICYKCDRRTRHECCAVCVCTSAVIDIERSVSGSRPCCHSPKKTNTKFLANACPILTSERGKVGRRIKSLCCCGKRHCCNISRDEWLT